jgi:rhamnosyltransferase
VGIRWALDRDDVGFVLLMDQDSIPAPDMVAQLQAGYQELAANNRQVAAVGLAVG